MSSRSVTIFSTVSRLLLSPWNEFFVAGIIFFISRISLTSKNFLFAEISICSYGLNFPTRHTPPCILHVCVYVSDHVPEALWSAYVNMTSLLCGQRGRPGVPGRPKDIQLDHHTHKVLQLRYKGKHLTFNKKIFFSFIGSYHHEIKRHFGIVFKGQSLSSGKPGLNSWLVLSKWDNPLHLTSSFVTCG